MTGLERLRAFAPAEVLLRASMPVRPLVSMWLAGDRTVTGFVLRVEDGMALCHEQEGIRGALAYVPVGAVVGVRIHEPMAVLPRLSDSRVETMITEGAPSESAIRRYLAARDGIPVNLPWDALEEEEARMSAYRLVKDIDRVLHSLGRDFGFSFLARITKIYLRPCVRPELERRRDCLRVGFDPLRGANGRPTPEALHAGITSLLVQG